MEVKGDIVGEYILTSINKGNFAVILWDFHLFITGGWYNKGCSNEFDTKLLKSLDS